MGTTFVLFCQVSMYFEGHILYFSLYITDGELEMVQKSKQTETEESKTVVHNGKEGENENQEPALNSDSEVIIKEVQKESVKPEEDTMKSKVEEPASGEDAELCSDKGEKEKEKQDEVGK